MNLAGAPWEGSGKFQSIEKLKDEGYWSYFESGNYELKATYFSFKKPHQKTKQLDSQVETITISPPTEEEKVIIQYIIENFPPRDFYFGIENKSFLDEATYIIKHFEDSVYAGWAMFYLVQQNLYLRLDEPFNPDLKERLLELSRDSTNPFFQETANHYLKLINDLNR